MTEYPSPNVNQRLEGTNIEYLIMHYTACDLDVSLKILTNPTSHHPVSAHYVIGEDGQIYKLVDESKRAWHVASGSSAWKSHRALNDHSIGIELVNPGHGPNYRDFSENQMQSLIQLSKDILSRHSIPPAQVLGHSDVDPVRKSDPGELFDWSRLAQEGIGFMPPKDFAPGKEVSLERMQTLLEQFGYLIRGTTDEWLSTKRAIIAFQMHFCPQYLWEESLKMTVGCLEKILNSK